MNRFFYIFVFLFLFTPPLSASPTWEQLAVFRSVASDFSSTKTMLGSFIQFAPDGTQSGGKFFIKRPGRIRFDYDSPSPILVKSDGRTVGVHNKALETWDYYPLRATPLGFLLSDEIEVEEDSVESVSIDDDLITIVLENKVLLSESRLTLLFDRVTNELKQWTIKDGQGRETTVIIYDTVKGIDLGARLFYLDRRGDDDVER